MKIKFLCTLMLAAIIGLTSCQNEPAPPGTGENNDSTLNENPNPDILESALLYNFDSARADIMNFDKNICPNDPFLSAHPMHGFTIRALDLLMALGIDTNYVNVKPSFNHIRVYLGYTNTDSLKLFIVPVKGADLINDIAGTDYFLDTSGSITSYSPKISSDLRVLDLTTPCPSTCDMNSPLYQE